MSAFDFPASPTINDLYSANNVTYICTGTSPSIWKKLGSDVSTGATKVAVVKDQKNTGVAGGLFVKDGWRDRDLTVKDDPFNFVTLYTNASYQTTPGTGGRASYFSLPAGKYKIKFRAPALSVNEHMAAIGWSPNESDINKTYANGDFNSGGEIYGSSEVSNNNTTTSIDVEVSNFSEGSGIVEITQTSYFKVIHYGKDTSTTSSGANLNTGFGNPVSIGSPDPETYTIVEIEDLATAVKSGADSFVLLSEKSATGAEVEFTGIPSDAMEITLMLKGVSPSGSNHYVVQLGTSSGYTTSGYVSNSENSQGTSAVSSNTTDKAGFVIFGSSSGGTSELHGSMIISKASSTSYTEIGGFRKANTGGCVTRGSLSSVSGTVDRLKIKFSGSDTFDAGTISVSYKTSGSGGSGVTIGDKIEEGDTSAEVIDTGTDGRFIVKTNNTEKLLIKGDTGNTFANSDDIILNGGGGTAENTQVKGVINMGTSYRNGTLYAGSGHWSALKLFLYKDTSNADNVYGFGLSNGVMEIQSNADIGFFVGRDSATTGSGSRTERIRITRDGHLLPGADNTQDLGASNLRWDNVYHTDLHLDNTGCGGNEVDGTEGSWKIQEGADNLFLINKITGKKYKINMTEVT